MHILAPTVTKLPARARGAVLLTGSHGGRYAGCLALTAGVRAAVFHDAGVGLDSAGVASLGLFDALGVPAAAVGHETARIGDPDDMVARGRISRANAAASALGVRPGMSAAEALARLDAAGAASYAPPRADEARATLPGAWSRPVVMIDSASLIHPALDRRAVVVTGSHGGLVGGDPALALRADAFAAVFNDAGIGMDQAGVARLPALDARGIAALCADALTCRIGEAASTYEQGVISAVNETAASMGALPGMRVQDVVLAWAA